MCVWTAAHETVCGDDKNAPNANKFFVIHLFFTFWIQIIGRFFSCHCYMYISRWLRDSRKKLMETSEWIMQNKQMKIILWYAKHAHGALCEI